jgi:(1->4)-alpha-D-glucan 1-alpha-D-glucosylmutase
VATIVPRLVLGLARAGGWGDTAVELPPGLWTDVLGATIVEVGDSPAPVPVSVGELLGRFPVALLVRR